MTKVGRFETELNGREIGTIFEPGLDVSLMITGMARSGTTVAQRIASEIEGVFVSRETHFWRHAAAMTMEFGMPLSRSAAEDALAWYLAKPSSAYLDLSPSDLVKQLPAQSYLWDFFRVVVGAMAPDGTVVLGEKTPDHIRWAPQLIDAVPDLRVVSLIRDPREVYRSHLGVSWGIHDPVRFGAKWAEISARIRTAESTFGDRFISVRYEDMVTSPESVRERIGALVGIDHWATVAVDAGDLFDPSESWKAGASREIARRDDTWLEALDEDTVRAIEDRCRHEMREWGYETTTSESVKVTRTVADREHARLAAEIDATPLPIDHRTVDDWAESSHAQLRLWRGRARSWEESAAIHRGRLVGRESQVAKLERKLEEAAQRVDELESQLSRSQAVATSLTNRNRHSEIERLEERKRRLISEGKLRRTRARKWWKLAGVLSRWRRVPLRVDRLLSESWDLLRDRSPLPPMPDTQAIDTKILELRSSLSAGDRTIDEAREALGNHDPEGVVERLGPIEEAAGSLQKLYLLRDAYIQQGELTLALQATNAARELSGDPVNVRRARTIEGRILETEPWWLPDPGEVRGSSISPRDRHLLHIVKESLPFFERGYTVRSHTSFRAQLEAGYSVVVTTTPGFPRDQGISEFEPVDVIDGIPYHRLDLGETYETTSVPYDQRLSDHAAMVLRVAESERPALIQSGSGYRGYETALVGLAVADKLGLPFIYEIRSFLEHTWTADLSRAETGEYYRRRYAQEVRCLTQADHVITIAESMRDEIIGRGVDPARVSVVPNVVDVERFTPREKRADLVERFGFGGKKVLGYISNIGQREGLPILIDALARLRSEGYDVGGLVVGDGPEREALEAQVEQLGLGDHVKITGHVPNEEIEDYYALIDLFVVPRIEDRASRLVTPLKPLEAMAMGIPIIASDLPALAEMVAPGERGLLFEAGSAGSLAETAVVLLDEPELGIDLAKTARSWVQAERTISANAVRYAEIFEEVLS